MWIDIFVFFLVPFLTFSADHGTYKDCSRVDFCTNLRSREPSDDYIVDSGSISFGANTLTATLSSTNGGSDLVLFLSGLQENTFRLKITEVDSDRYELQDVLDGEPQSLDFDDSIQMGDNSATVSTASGSNSAVINFSPFSIEFIKNDVTEVVFNGDRLTVTRNDVTAPFSFGVTFPQAVQLYGLHEHCDSLALQNTSPGGTDPYRLKNSDVAFYELNSPMALYGAVPFVYGHGPQATAGVFLHNAAEQWIETSSNQDGNSFAYFMVEIGSLDVFVLLGAKPVDLVRQYTTLTGVAHLPQLWTLGYHQSRYSYETQDLAKEIVSNFDSNNFPLDALWLDIDYTDGYKYFTWNPTTYNDPVALQDYIASTNKKLVTIIDPHIKVEQGYSVYDGALSNDLFVKNSDGSVFEGPCWPGTSSYMDFLNPAARDYYAGMYSFENFQGSTSTLAGFWNDMNEPSVFDNSLEMTLPADSLHYGNVRHREIHNIYGFLQTIATHQGLLQRDDGKKRPFVLTRSHFAGSQRYAAFWTGDNSADWTYLHAAFQECLNANMLGLVFCGADVGGFFNNPTDELMERWYQAGAWLPFYRAHSNKDTNRREPYLLPDESQDIIRKAIQTRYQHLPVWYTLFYEHTRRGDPVIRPLFYHYPEDTNVYGIDNLILVGRDILVRCVHDYSGATNLDVYFPGGENEVWISANSDDVQVGNGYANVEFGRENIPVYYRRGAVIARKDTIRLNTVEMTDDSYSLYYTLNQNNTASSMVYIDDGISFQYRDDLNYNYFDITIDGDNVSVTNADGNGDYEFVIDQVVHREIISLPQENKPGKYKETVFKTDVNGVLLRDIKITPKKENCF